MPESTAARLDLLARFRQMYTDCHFEPDLFDLDDGYLQTTLAADDRMPLRFFVEYNNAWWFAIISGVSVPMIAYDPVSDSGSIVLDIDYDGQLLQAMQHVKFGDGVITRIQTYASSTFFSRPYPLVELDRHGNSMWLDTGYDLATSLAAAEVFLATPRGQHFTDHAATAAAVTRIHHNLAELRQRL